MDVLPTGIIVSTNSGMDLGRKPANPRIQYDG
jgi:hypothetical protein